MTSRDNLLALIAAGLRLIQSERDAAWYAVEARRLLGEYDRAPRDFDPDRSTWYGEQ